jgi:RND family efflux transporter MFP subunit
MPVGQFKARRLAAGSLVALLVLAVPAAGQTPPAGPPQAAPGFFSQVWTTVTGWLGLASPPAPGAPGAGGPPPPVVTVARPSVRTLSDTDEYTGRFVAAEAVEIRARVSGYLDRIAFADGQLVSKGDLLFVIDQRPFKAALDQARADLARARAAVEFADSELARAQRLIGQQTISEAVFEQRVQAKRQADAQVQSTEAAIRRAELDLEFTELRAPISGRIGDRRVAAGNLVTGGTQGNTTLLANIVSQDPIRFEFTTDEAAFLRYVRLGMAGRRAEAGAQPTPVQLQLIDERDFRHSGQIDFLDNVFDDTAGTIRGRAIFPNPQGLFTPGMFGRIRLPASAPYQAVLVPDAAIAAEQARRIVWVVGADNTVQPRGVELGRLVEGGLRVVRSGLAPDERIVVNGLLRIQRPGIRVNPQEAGAPPAGAPAAGAPPAAAPPAGAPPRAEAPVTPRVN